MDAALQSKMCRICMRSASKRMLIGLFEHIIHSESLARIVSLVGAVEVKQDDELPKLCCKQCLREVEAAHKLRVLCQESDLKLRSNLPDQAAVVRKEPLSDNESISLKPEGLVSSDEFLAQKDVDKLHSLIPNEAVVVKKESFSDDNMNSPDPENLTSNDDDLAQKDVDKVHSLTHVPSEAVVVKDESFSDDEMNSPDPEDLTSSDDDLAQMEVEELNSFTPDGLKYEYEEITIEDTRLIDSNCSKSDQCSDSKHSISNDNDEYSSNNQELETDISEDIPLRNQKLLKIFDTYPAVKFSCCGCKSSFDNLEELRAHGREKHFDTDSEGFTLKERQCDICFKVLYNGRAYDFHRKNIMHNYRCKLCDKVLITLKQTFAHKEQHKGQRTWRPPTADEALICCGCKTRFCSAEELRIHSETIHLPEKPPPDETKPVTCNICYRNYKSKYTLRTHKLGYVEQRKNYQCKECGKLFPSLGNVKRHEIARHETSRRPKSRRIKPGTFDHAKTRSPKIFDKYPAVKLSCCGCKSSFDTIEDLRAHGREIHCDADLENFTLKERQCDICFKVLRNEESYDFHRRNVKYNYRCKLCDKILITLRQALAHKGYKHSPKRLTSDEVLICCGCKKQFDSAEELRIHSETIHLPEIPRLDEKKPVTCNICYRNYSTNETLRKHKLGYAGERKNYDCKECGKPFRDRYHRNRHQKSVHENHEN